MERQDYLDKLLKSYSSWYDIETLDEAESPLAAKAAYHEHGSGYLLSKKAVLYTADKHEYVWFFSVPHLTQELYQSFLDRVVAEGLPKVDPKPGHMSTALTCVVLCDEADEETLMAAKKCRIRKSFQFSLRGWMEVQTVVAEMRRAAVTGNAPARDTAEFLKNLLHPKVEQKKAKLFKIK